MADLGPRRRPGRLGRRPPGDHRRPPGRGAPGRREDRRRRRRPREDRRLPRAAQGHLREGETTTMALNKVWVFAEADSPGKPTSLTLELLTKAREMAGTVEAFYAGADPEGMAGPLGRVRRHHRLRPRHRRLPHRRAGRRRPRRADRRAPARRHRLRRQLRRPRRLRPAVGPHRPPRPVQRHDLGGRRRRREGRHRHLRRQHAGRRRLQGRRTPHLAIFRPKSFTAEPGGGSPAQVVPVKAVDTGHAGEVKILQVHEAEQVGPEAGGRRRRRLRRPGSRRGRQLQAGRGAGQAAQGRRRRVPGHRRRRLGALLAPGRPDRQDRQAQGLHRRRHLRRHPAHGRHEGLRQHHRHQQGSRRRPSSASPTSASWATSTR